jgi:hypothetical protein
MSMKYLSIIFVITLIFTGCSTKQTVVRESDSVGDGTINYSQLNEEIEGAKAKLVLVDGSACVAEDVRLGVDTTFFKDWTHLTLKRIPTSTIAMLQTNRTQERSTWDLSHVMERQLDVQRINDELGGAPAWIVLVNGDKYDAQEIRLGKDTTVFADRSQPRLQHIPTRDIVKIETRNHSQGAFDGLFWGLVGGGLFGYGLGETLTADVSRESSSTHGLAMFVMTAGSALLGTVGGVTYGAVHGHATEYTIIHQVMQIK